MANDLEKWIGKNAFGLGAELSVILSTFKEKEDQIRNIMSAVRNWSEYQENKKNQFTYQSGTRPDAILEVMCRKYSLGEVEDIKFLEDNSCLYWGFESGFKENPDELNYQDYKGKRPGKNSDSFSLSDQKKANLIQFYEVVFAFQIQRVVGEGILTEDSLGSDATSGFEFDVENEGEYNALIQFADSLLEDAKACFDERENQMEGVKLVKKRGNIEAVKFLVLTGYWSEHTSTSDGEDYDAGIDYFGRISLSQIGKFFEVPKQRGTGCLE